MRRSNTWLVSIGALLFVVICVLCHERHLSGRDTSNFVLAIRYGYSVVGNRPHAPGYPAFYVVWKCIEWLTNWPAHRILLVTNTGFALIACWLTYITVRRWAGDQSAGIAALLVLSNPLLLYFTNTTELYAYDAAYSAFLVWLLIAARSEFWPYVIYGLLASFRLSSFILTVPVVVIVVSLRAFYSRDLKHLLLSLLGIAVGFISWFIPFVLYLGGWETFKQVMAVANGYPGFAPVQNLLSFSETAFWSFNCLIAILLFGGARIWNYVRRNMRDWRFFAILLLVAFPGSFFAFQYSTKGYTLLCLAPIVLLATWIFKQQRRPLILGGVAVAANLLVFFAAPFYAPSSRSVLAHDVRSSAERWQSALLRGTSWFLPSNSHLRASDDAAREQLALIDRLPRTATVVVDAAAGAWMNDRCIATERPGYRIIGNFSNGHLESYQDSAIDIDFSRQHLDAPFYELTARELASEISANLVPVAQSTRFCLFLVPNQARESFFQRLDSLYVRK